MLKTTNSCKRITKELRCIYLGLCFYAMMYSVLSSFELKPSIKMNIYLYDYVVDQPTNSVFLFGIDENGRKH